MPIKLNATVDPHETSSRHWTVTVWDIDVAERTKVYVIEADTDTMAAMEGIRRMEAEYTGVDNGRAEPGQHPAGPDSAV